jgi:3',5'-cyclic-AMP phosphodiesterase
MTIAFITDIHLDEVDMDSHSVDPYHNWRIILNDVKQQAPHLIIIGGDVGAPSAYPYFFSTLNDLAIPYHVIPGNHDSYNDLIQHYQEPLQGQHQELYYSFDDEHTRFIFLDSLSNSVSTVQQQWLARELATPHHIMLFVHHPVLYVDTPVDHLYPMQNRAELKAVLDASGKKVDVFCGHYHLPHQQTESKISQYITPAASYQIIENASKITISDGPFGYRLIRLHADKMDTELIWLRC